LEEMGLLKREFRRKGELNQSNVFYLTLDNAQQIQPESGGAGADPRTYHSFEPVKEPKNIMFERVRTKCEKSPDLHEETDKAFEEIFWCAG
ncbi:helix-turn-helix domain-containing protein, partial [Escherichia albertii]|nr:helix-turn-helix domain-containing protein [Escherichia albertii]